MQTLGCLNLALRRYTDFTNHKSFTVNKWDSLISRGFSLSELSMMANDMFGEILFMEYAVNLMYATFGAYFATSIVNVYDSELGRINQPILILSLFNIAQAVFSIYRVYLMQNQGQKMCDQFYAIKKNLEDICVRSSKNLASDDSKKLDVLVSRFGETSPIRDISVYFENESVHGQNYLLSSSEFPSGQTADLHNKYEGEFYNSSKQRHLIRPCGVFDMNTANFVSIGGIILTYLIVLLQFKFSAEKDENRFNLNVEDMPSLLGNCTLDEFFAFMDDNDRTLTDWRLFRSNKTSQ